MVADKDVGGLDKDNSLCNSLKVFSRIEIELVIVSSKNKIDKW